MTVTTGKRGRPKGYPKSGGRKPGVPNKSTSEIREIALAMCPEMMANLAKLARTAESESTRVSASIAILQWGIGKPRESHEISGPEGQALFVPPVIDVCFTSAHQKAAA
jgi:hypothetical protein